ncbi:MAG: Sec-independent protein translocase protein TatB, partial [Gammaproteobacteria bacterium]
MFDVGFWELALLGAIALLIIGPERLPAAARVAGHWIGQARRILRDAKSDLDRELRAHEPSGLGELKRGILDAGAELQSAGETLHQAGAQAGKQGADALRQTFQQASPLAGVKKAAKKKISKKKISKKKGAKKKPSKKRISKKPAAKRSPAKKAAKKKPSKKKSSKRRA